MLFFSISGSTCALLFIVCYSVLLRICDCADFGHEPIEGTTVDHVEGEFENLAWIDDALCGSEASHPIYGVEFWAAGRARVRLFVAEKINKRGKWPLLAYSNSIDVKGSGAFRVLFREPKLLHNRHCFGWMSNLPIIPFVDGLAPTEVFIFPFEKLQPLGTEMDQFRPLPPRTYSIRLLGSPYIAHSQNDKNHTIVSFAERKLVNHEPRAHGTAVCIAGDLRMLSLTAKSIMDFLIRPLSADLFIYGPKPRMDDQASLGWLMTNPDTKAVRLLAENLTSTMRFLPRAHKDALAYAMCEMPGNWLGGAPKISKCTVDELPEHIGWVPPQGQIEGSGVFQMWARRQCVAMVSEYEAHMRGGRHYETLVYSRSDLKWLLPHPTVQQLEARNAGRNSQLDTSISNPFGSHRCWIPQTGGDDWGGLYDRHMVLPRWLAESSGVMNDWDLLFSGLALEWLTQALDFLGEVRMGGSRTLHGVNTELWLSVRLYFAGANVARFPALAYVACNPEDWTYHFESKPTSVKHRFSKAFPCQSDGFRFPQEHMVTNFLAECTAMERDHGAAQRHARGISKTANLDDSSSLWHEDSVLWKCANLSD